MIKNSIKKCEPKYFILHLRNMLSTIIIHSQLILGISILICVFLKAVLFFFNKTENDTLLFFFHYPSDNITKSKNLQRVEHKSKQNMLGLIIITLILAFVIVALFFKMYGVLNLDETTLPGS